MFYEELRGFRGRELSIGFTGTQQGMTDAQIVGISHLFYMVGPVATIHHGDCVGADAQFDAMARKSLPDVRVMIHPPVNLSKRAFMAQSQEENLPPEEYLERNRSIVDSCHLLVAAPKSNDEEIRSGTWFTVRYARRVRRAHCIIYPGGLYEPIVY